MLDICIWQLHYCTLHKSIPWLSNALSRPPMELCKPEQAKKVLLNRHNMAKYMSLLWPLLGASSDAILRFQMLLAICRISSEWTCSINDSEKTDKTYLSDMTSCLSYICAEFENVDSFDNVK